MRTRRFARPAGLTGLLALTLIPLHGCAQKPASSPSSPSAPAVALKDTATPQGQPGQEEAAVKQTIEQLAKAQSLTDMAPHFTNESAAVLGMVMMIPLSFAAAFEAPDSKTPNPVKGELEALLKRYEIESGGKPPSAEAQSRLMGQGRQFLADLDAVMTRLQKDGQMKSEGMSFDRKKFDSMLGNVTFTVVSPTRVKITPNDKKEQPIEARVEDGAWRLHLIGLDELQKMQGAPPGP